MLPDIESPSRCARLPYEFNGSDSLVDWVLFIRLSRFILMFVVTLISEKWGILFARPDKFPRDVATLNNAAAHSPFLPI